MRELGPAASGRPGERCQKTIHTQDPTSGRRSMRFSACFHTWHRADHLRRHICNCKRRHQGTRIGASCVAKPQPI